MPRFWQHHEEAESAALTAEAREQLRRRRLLSILILAIAVLLIPQLVVYSLQQQWATAAVMTGTLLALGYTVYLNQTGKTSLAAIIMLLAVTLGSFAGISVDAPGVRLLDWTVFGFPVLICGLFLPAWVPFVLAIGDGIAAVICGSVPLLRTNFYPSGNPLYYEVSTVFILGAFAVIGSLYAWSTNKAIRVARNTEELQELYGEVAARNAALQDANDRLHEMHDRLATNHESLIQMNQRLELLASRDPLTGVYNHRAIAEQLARLLEQRMHRNTALTLCFLDIDHFKKINDTYGHACGDIVLEEFVRLIQHHLRPGDLVGRWGGEEFIVLLPETVQDEGTTIAENIRLAVANHPFASQQLHVTCSTGITTATSAVPLNVLIDEADQAMYAAKHSGRNRVCHFTKQARAA